LHTFCDANWAPQGASHPSSTNLCNVSITESKSICGHIFFFGGSPILGKTHKESRISQSACEAEIKSSDKCVKNIQMFCHVLEDLQLLDPSCPTPVLNDNCGLVDWSNSFSTKVMHHLVMRENAVREADLYHEVTIDYIPGECNPADIFTKEFQSDCMFHSFQNLLLFPPSHFVLSYFLALMGGITFLEFPKEKHLLVRGVTYSETSKFQSLKK
jgi:hypothetical protein